MAPGQTLVQAGQRLATTEQVAHRVLAEKALPEGAPGQLGDPVGEGLQRQAVVVVAGS